MPPSLPVAALLLVLLSACSRSPSDPPGVPTVTLVDSLVVADPDTFPGRQDPPIVARSGRGDLFIAVRDGVLHFGEDGRFIRVIGVAGEGPGELRDVAGFGALPGDSVLAVVAAGRSRIVLFRLSDGAPLGEVTVAEPFNAGLGWAVVGDTLVIPTYMSTGPFRRWAIGSETVRTWGAPPPSSREGGSRAYMVGGIPSAAPFAGAVVALYPADSALVVHDASGAIVRRVVLPTVRRRMLAADVEEQVRAGIAERPPRFVYPGPLVLGLHRLPDGRYVTVHLEFTAEPGDDPMRLEYSDVHYWVSLVSADLSRACVDGEIPDPPADVIRPIFFGDTVALLVRSLDGDGEPRSVLRQYRVTDAGCGWVGVGSGPDS